MPQLQAPVEWHTTKVFYLTEIASSIHTCIAQIVLASDTPSGKTLSHRERRCAAALERVAPPPATAIIHREIHPIALQKRAQNRSADDITL